jgi:hypothetical protein
MARQLRVIALNGMARDTEPISLRSTFAMGTARGPMAGGSSVVCALSRCATVHHKNHVREAVAVRR